jgi:post-segregation antitoxin (ccd killing protein)
MPKITVYLPDDLAEFVRADEQMNVSAIVQHALRREMALKAQAELVAADEAAGLLDEAEVTRWRKRLSQTRKSSSTVPS